MNDWLHGLDALNRRGEPAALVTVMRTRGSTPREEGAKMAVGLDAIHGTIGGGQLEHAAIESARLLLEGGGTGYVNHVERHDLGPALGQCCGGVATLLFERLPARERDWIDTLLAVRREHGTAFLATAVGGKYAVTRIEDLPATAPAPLRRLLQQAMARHETVYENGDGDEYWFVEPVRPVDFRIVLFGAGHVGRALADILATLPCHLTWVDGRAHLLPDQTPANVRIECTRAPEKLVDECLPGTFYVLMTHSHPLDLSICERILKRDDFSYCGLIGSESKKRHFEKRLRLKGVTETAWNRLTCPIGVGGVSGKHPAEIAVAVAAELLQVRNSILTRRETGASTAV